MKTQRLTLATTLGTLLLFGGCSKKVAKTTPPPPPPPAAPTATLAASPTVVQQGQQVKLNWQTSNANKITVEGLGNVPASGYRSVTPSGSTTYTLTAKGPGGTQEATVRVTVNPRPLASVQPSEDEFTKSVNDIFFDYDKSDIRSDQRTTAIGDARYLAAHPNLKIVIEGHCDDRGSEEYNLALGDSRANSVKTALVSEGVSADRVKTISYGKERPFCSQDNEQCWNQNRRGHFQAQP